MKRLNKLEDACWIGGAAFKVSNIEESTEFKSRIFVVLL